MPVHLQSYNSLDRELLAVWRKNTTAARENWLALKSQYGQEDRELARLAKSEAAECLKHERACTQIIEYIDGKRAGFGELTGDKGGHLLYRVPDELESAFRFCLAMAEQ